MMVPRHGPGSGGSPSRCYRRRCSSACVADYAFQASADRHPHRTQQRGGGPRQRLDLLHLRVAPDRQLRGAAAVLSSSCSSSPLAHTRPECAISNAGDVCTLTRPRWRDEQALAATEAASRREPRHRRIRKVISYLLLSVGAVVILSRSTSPRELPARPQPDRHQPPRSSRPTRCGARIDRLERRPPGLYLRNSAIMTAIIVWARWSTAIGRAYAFASCPSRSERPLHRLLVDPHDPFESP